MCWPRPWPDVGAGRREVTDSAAFGGALVWNAPEGRVRVTANGQGFEEVRNLTGMPLRWVGSDLPGRRTKLAATEGGAALVADCP
ncbi:MAG: hypothetical protein OEM24_02345 [Paracoccaceae bacterium]|nr:hypothetical protein [Paracoccaceae bacterium]